MKQMVGGVAQLVVCCFMTPERITIMNVGTFKFNISLFVASVILQLL